MAIAIYLQLFLVRNMLTWRRSDGIGADCQEGRRERRHAGLAVQHRGSVRWHHHGWRGCVFCPACSPLAVRSDSCLRRASGLTPLPEESRLRVRVAKCHNGVPPGSTRPRSQPVSIRASVEAEHQPHSSWNHTPSPFSIITQAWNPTIHLTMESRPDPALIPVTQHVQDHVCRWLGFPATRPFFRQSVSFNESFRLINDSLLAPVPYCVNTKNPSPCRRYRRSLAQLGFDKYTGIIVYL